MNHKNKTHQWILQFSPLDLSVDMTAGNGYDTLFLAKHSKKVIAIDIQASAIENTRIKCEAFSNINYILCNHQNIVIPGKISGLMYNLGYLPGSDKTIVTHEDSTISSLNKLLTQTEKFITISCYRKHPGGEQEYLAVRKWVESLPYKFEILEYETELSPVTFLINLTIEKSLI